MGPVDESPTRRCRTQVDTAYERARRHNELVSIHRLPAELLCEIFRRGHAARLSHVCAHWRRIALSDPRLWQSVNVPTGSSTDMLADMLSRSQPMLVAVRVAVPLHAPARGALCALLGANVGRMSALSLKLPSWDARDHLPLIFDQPAPSIATLSIAYTKLLVDPLVLPRAILQRSWPSLRRVQLYHVQPPFGASRLFDTVVGVRLDMRRMMGLDIEAVLIAFPALQNLCAACDVYTNITSRRDAFANRPPHKLRALRLDISSTDLVPLLEQLRFRTIGSIVVDWTPLIVARLAADFAAVERVAVLPRTISSGTFWNVLLQNAHGKRRLFRMVPQAHALKMVRDAPCADVTIPFDLLTSTRVAPHLRKLTLLIGYGGFSNVPTASLQYPADPRLFENLTVDELVLSAHIPAEFRDAVDADVFRASVGVRLRLQAVPLDMVLRRTIPACAEQPRTLVGIDVS